MQTFSAIALTLMKFTLLNHKLLHIYLYDLNKEIHPMCTILYSFDNHKSRDNHKYMYALYV